MIKFSVKTQTHYDSTLDYSNLPDDLIEVTNEKHQENLDALNRGCYIFPDLTYSEPKPSQFHEWNGTEWIDPRTPEEIAEYERSLIQPITKRQFALSLDDYEKYDEVMDLLQSDRRAKIEYDSVADIERISPTVQAMTAALGLTEEYVDEFFKYARSTY